MYKSPVNSRINYRSTGAGFLPSTVLFDHLSFNSWDLSGIVYNQAPPLHLSATKLTHRGSEFCEWRIEISSKTTIIRWFWVLLSSGGWQIRSTSGGFQNRGTPKWMVYNGKPYWNGWFGGIPIFGNTHLELLPPCPPCETAKNLPASRCAKRSPVALWSTRK